ncbi:MAG: hypothetical protein N2C13_02065, partial [Chloroflexota bacterium]
MEIVLWVSGGLALLLIVAGVVLTVTRERSLVDDRVGKYLDQGADDEFSEFGESDQGTAFVTDWINTRVEKSSFGDNIKRELARADLKLKPGEYVATM